MHWVEELYYTTMGSVPLLGLPVWGLRMARHGAPTSEEFVRSTVATTLMGYGIDLLHKKITGSPNLGDFRKYKTIKTVQYGGRALVYGGIAAVPVGISAAATYSYEKNVNEPIRDTTSNTSGVWRGPFASGFGSVV